MLKLIRQYFTPLLCAALGTSTLLAGPSDQIGGNYGGVITPDVSDPPANSGLVQVQLSNAGVMSGTLIWQGQRYPFKGKLVDGGSYLHKFKKKASSTPIDLGIFLSLTGGSQLISGTVTETVGLGLIFSRNFTLNGAPADPGLIESLQPGLRISFIDPPDPSNEGEEALAADGPVTLGPTVAEIPGDGFVHVRVAKSKKRFSRMIGKLPDASGAFTAGSPLRGADYTVFSSLYKAKRKQGGQLFGDANVTAQGSGAQLTSTLRWGKDADPDSLYYPQGVNQFISLDALTYPKLKRGALVPLLPRNTTLLAASVEPFGIIEPTRSINARMLFRRGNISVPDGLGGFERFFKQNIKIKPFSTTMVGGNPFQIKIQVDAFSGRFHGSFMHPVLNARTKFRGAFQAAILLAPGQGRGHFRPPSGPRIIPLAEPLESGAVRINVTN